MAHFAEVDINNKVLRVLVACNQDITNNGGDYSDQAATHFETVVSFSPTGVKWLQTSINTEGGVHLLGGTPHRKNFAGKDGNYDPAADAFYAPQPYGSWVLNTETYRWDPPTPKPSEDDKAVNWDESGQKWTGVNRTLEANGTHLTFDWNPNTNSWDSSGSLTPETDQTLDQ